MPAWRDLPEEARGVLTGLMMRLILKHTQADSIVVNREVMGTKGLECNHSQHTSRTGRLRQGSRTCGCDGRRRRVPLI